MGSSCCYLAQSCSTFAKNSTLGNLDDVFFTGGRKQHEEGGTDLGSRFQGGPLNKSKACQRTLWTLCLVNTIPWAPILVLSLVMGLTAPKLLIENSHMKSTLQNHRILVPVHLSIYLLFFFWWHILGGKQICLNYRIETHPTWVTFESYNIIHQSLLEERSHVTAATAHLNIGITHAYCPAAPGTTTSD